jgi:hypothetical protein
MEGILKKTVYFHEYYARVQKMFSMLNLKLV